MLGQPLNVAQERPHKPFERGVVVVAIAAVLAGHEPQLDDQVAWFSNVTYFLSGEYRDQLGSLPNNESVQRSLRGNFNLIPSATFDLSISASYNQGTGVKYSAPDPLPPFLGNETNGSATITLRPTPSRQRSSGGPFRG